MNERAVRSQPTSGLPYFQIRKISESEIEAVVNSAGGRRAHLDADKRSLQGADFVLGSSVIELKILEDEGLDKLERQHKLAKLFRKKFPHRPTIVLDRKLLDIQGQREYEKIMEGPIKTEIRKARKQLKQSRSELNVINTVLWVINNGYSSLDHSELMELVENRVRNDTSNIDDVVVSGAYFYSDSFDNFVLWVIDCIPINSDRCFQGFGALHEAWNALATRIMTESLTKPEEADETKEPIVDLSFQLDGVTYVMPAPLMERESEFFVNGRPRNNSTGITSYPPVATVFAGLCRSEWAKFKQLDALPDSFFNYADYSDWITAEARARSMCQLKPFITIPITFVGWREWARQLPKGASDLVHYYANDLFQEKFLSVIYDARELTDKSVLPHRYMLLITEEIGQDLAFDVSHLAEVRTLLSGNDYVDEVWTDKSMFFEQALAVAAAEAIARKVEYVFWQKDKTYAWS